MMEAIALPLRLEQPEEWPFDLIVTDAIGVDVINQQRHCHSSKDRTVAEAVGCVHFGHADREAAAAANRAQIASLEAIVRAANSHDQMLAALKDIAAMTDPDDPDCYRSDDREGCLDAVQSAARAAIAKAEGQS
jgi:hypothetical protein